MAILEPNRSQQSGLSTRAARHGVWVALACVACIIIWGHHRLELLLLVGFLAPLTVAHVLSMTLVGSVCWGVGVERISIFYGEPLFRFRLGSIPIEVGYLPTGGSTTFHRTANVGACRQGVRTYEGLHPWQRVVVILSGPSLLLLLGYAFVGGNELLGVLHRFIPTFVSGTMSPGTQGVETLTSYFRFLEQGDYRIAFGVLAVVLAAVNLLPLPTLNGGEAVIELVQALSRHRLATKTTMVVRICSLLVALAVTASWAFALVCVLFFR